MAFNKVKDKIIKASLLNSLELNYAFTKKDRTRHVNITIADGVASYYSWRYNKDGSVYDERKYNYDLIDLHEAKLFKAQMLRKNKLLDHPQVKKVILKKTLE